MTKEEQDDYVIFGGVDTAYLYVYTYSRLVGG
jgi:hypothetical protein